MRPTRLRELRDHLLRRQNLLTKDALEEQPSFSTHMADAATDTYDRDFALSMLSCEQDSLYEIDEALDLADLRREHEVTVEVEGEQGGREEKGEAPGEIAGEGEAEPEGTRAMKLGAKRQFNQETRTPIQREAAAPLATRRGLLPGPADDTLDAAPR